MRIMMILIFSFVCCNGIVWICESQGLMQMRHANEAEKLNYMKDNGIPRLINVGRHFCSI